MEAGIVDTTIKEWLQTEHAAMGAAVERWSAINTHTRNLAGLRELGAQLAHAFMPVADSIEWQMVEPMVEVGVDGCLEECPLAPVLVARCRPTAPVRVLLGIHMDTVYPQSRSTDVVTNGQRLFGPGVADAKGGIAVMLWGLRAFEMASTQGKSDLGWTVFINADEELGSPGSQAILQELAPGHVAGLVYEPCLPDGALVGTRKGSGNFALVVRGRSAHAGREPHHGRNAISKAAECVVALEKLSRARSGLMINVGCIDGGGPVNVVPDVAIIRFNVRLDSDADIVWLNSKLDTIVMDVAATDGYSAELHGGITSPPKPERAHRSLFERVVGCAQAMGLDLSLRPTGGVCDGNKLGAVGLPTVDTMGVCGGGIHSSEEYCELGSLTERAELTARVMASFTTGS